MEPVDLPELEAAVSALRDSFRAYPGRAHRSETVRTGPAHQKAPIAIRVFGEDLDSLRRRRHRRELSKSTEGNPLYVNNPLKTTTPRPGLEHQHRQSRCSAFPPADRQDRCAWDWPDSASRRIPGRVEEDYTINAARSGATRSPDPSVLDKLYVTSLTRALVPAQPARIGTVQRACPPSSTTTRTATSPSPATPKEATTPPKSPAAYSTA